MEDKDYSKRTSPMYDDRDGDTLHRMDSGLIKVCEGEAPKMAFFLVPRKGESQDGIPAINLMVEGYVRLGALSDDLKARVRQELQVDKPVPVRCDPFFPAKVE